MRERRIIVVSNRLPVAVEFVDGRLQAQRTIGGLASALSALGATAELTWIGWPGLHTDEAGQRAEIENRLQTEFAARPVFIPPDEFDLYYNGFSNNCLWPLFHYFPRLAVYDSASWQAYQAVNQRFAERVLEIARPGDLIWVHDYHLLLLPALLRRQLPEAAIGFFLHIPFPSYEVFRELPWREPLLRGMLGSDLTGFHSFDYMRHFLSSLLRGLGLESDFGHVVVGDRVVRADTFPLGVDAAQLEEMAGQPDVLAQCAELRRNSRSSRVILSVDRLDFTKGIAERLLALERFLTDHPEWRGQVSLVMVCVPSRTEVPAYQQLKRQIDELVGRINGEFGTPEWIPISYLYRGFTLREMVAFYLAADVALVTPLRDGMNLVAKEYLACRRDNSGVLILSETAGAASELGEALVVNPNNLEGIAEAIAAALAMPPEEQAERNRPMRERLQRYNVHRWADDFLTRLEEARAVRNLHRRRQLQGSWREKLLAAYQASQRRLLLLDYDGTLVRLARLPDQAVPDDSLRALLRRLAADPRNTLIVISGRDHQTLEAWLGGLGITLAAEHGAWLLEGGQDWQAVDVAGDTDWKGQIRPWLEMFVDRTPGALIEEKDLALAWHYRTADPELGSLRAKELADTLSSFVANTPLHVLRGNKVLEIKQSGVGKGKAAMRWAQAQPAPDFFLAVGDDETDEDLFTALPEGGWSVRVGQALHSRAGFYLNSPDEVRALLHEMAALDAAHPAANGQGAG